MAMRLVALALALSAGGWDATFVPGAVASYLPQPLGRVMVVRGGARQPALDAAGEALVRALRASGRPRLVLDDASFGSLEGLDDGAIVARCVGLPIDLVLIARAVPGVAGQPDALLVAAYDLSGLRRAAFTAQEGEPLVYRPPELLPVTSAALGGLAPESQEAYDRSYVFFETQVTEGEDGLSSSTEPVQGRSKHPLAMDEFYRLVGRADLAEEYRQRSALHGWVLVGGVGLSVLGPLASVGFMLWRPGPQPGDCAGPGQLACEQQVEQTQTRNIALGVGASIGAALVGSAMIVYGVASPSVQPPEKDRELAEGYNRQLRQRLGLPNASREGPAGRAVRLSLAPALGPRTGGLALRLDY